MAEDKTTAAVEQVRQFIRLLEDRGPQVVGPDAPLVRSLRELLALLDQSERTGA